jgi:hypothetical protein
MVVGFGRGHSYCGSHSNRDDDDDNIDDDDDDDYDDSLMVASYGSWFW